MQINKFLLTGILCAFTFLSYAQSGRTTISGLLRDDKGEPVPAASIKLRNTSIGAVSDYQGHYVLELNQVGRFVIEVYSLGYGKLTKEVVIESGRDLKLNFVLKASYEEMETVSVIGRSAVQEVNRQAFNVVAVDAKKLHNSTLDISHALDRVAGVRIRESGGVGSRQEFALNGFTGRQVRFFLDGVPMDNFGSSFQINNIPINLAERVEVYKGVVPVWLGADALGGAVNIVTSTTPRTYLDASYSFGSFNTHKTSVNAGYIDKSGFTFQLNAFQNYSDNNYWMDVKEVTDTRTWQYFPVKRVKRFHDNYHNETVIANVGVVNKKYADKLLFGVTLGQNKADIQTGARLEAVFGQWHRRGNIIMPSVKYQKKDLFVKGLALNVSGNYNLGSEQNIDTVGRTYNLLGQFTSDGPGPGGENSRSLYKYRNHNGIASANLSFDISDAHSLMLNNVFNTFNRKGSDELSPESDSYEQPRVNIKNVLALGYRFRYNEKWNTSVFGKYYYQKTKFAQAIDTTTVWGAPKMLIRQSKDFNKYGYGIATTYFLKSNLQVKASYERTFRMAEPDELFGEIGSFSSNPDLNPESSNNVNVGLTYNTHINKVHRFSLDLNGIHRYTNNFIRREFDNNQILYIHRNRGDVTTLGVDAEIRYSYKRIFTAGVNFTYQNVRNDTKYEKDQNYVSFNYRDRMPNLPYQFGNADASVFLTEIGRKGNNLNFGYNLLYVAPFYLNWPGQGTAEEKFRTNVQLAHDVNVVYTMANGKYNLSLECKNLFDNKLVDNYSLPKPSRGFFLKARYYISK